MEKFEMYYPVEGTSALKPKLSSESAQPARIISFPELRTRQDARTGCALVRVERGSFVHRVESTVAAAMAGTVQGSSFGRMQRWQAVAGGCTFVALAFGSLLLSL